MITTIHEKMCADAGVKPNPAAIAAELAPIALACQRIADDVRRDVRRRADVAALRCSLDAIVRPPFSDGSQLPHQKEHERMIEKDRQKRQELREARDAFSANIITSIIDHAASNPGDWDYTQSIIDAIHKWQGNDPARKAMIPKEDEQDFAKSLMEEAKRTKTRPKPPPTPAKIAFSRDPFRTDRAFYAKIK